MKRLSLIFFLFVFALSPYFGLPGWTPALAAALKDVPGLKVIIANKSMPLVAERLKSWSTVWRVS